mmetsp:Transcript_4152/g.11756  ORF Transcript_4152/g.11756 Transcript_4152/m.11756 type:complete len:282 (-) Transcript_4152:139-984(-)
MSEKHRKEHQTECQRIKKELDKRGGELDLGSELDVGPLGEVPPRDECPICMRVLPIHPGLQKYYDCCGKIVCKGCKHQHDSNICAFCREPMAESDKETLARLRKGVDRKDPRAMFEMASVYGFGTLTDPYGLLEPVDQAKGIDLLRQSGDLGCSVALYRLGIFHHTGGMGVEENEEEGLKYFAEAAEAGDVHARDHLGRKEDRKGNHVAAMRHWRLSAAGGYTPPMGDLIGCFEDGLLHHGDLAETLQAMYRSRAEMRSEERVQYIEHMKETGRYNDGFDL